MLRFQTRINSLDLDSECEYGVEGNEQGVKTTMMLTVLPSARWKFKHHLIGQFSVWFRCHFCVYTRLRTRTFEELSWCYIFESFFKPYTKLDVLLFANLVLDTAKSKHTQRLNPFLKMTLHLQLDLVRSLKFKLIISPALTSIFVGDNAYAVISIFQNNFNYLCLFLLYKWKLDVSFSFNHTFVDSIPSLIVQELIHTIRMFSLGLLE